MNVQVFAISHPRFSERYDYIKKHLAVRTKLLWEIIGVDGRELFERTDFEALGHSQNLSAGQIGCALGHCLAYQKMVDLGLTVALVVEDDVKLPKNLDEILTVTISHILPGEVIQLHNPMMEANPFSTVNATSVLDMNLMYPMSPRSIRSASAYLITIDAARAILELNNPVQHVADQWDKFYDLNCVSSYRILHPSPVRWLPFESAIGYVASDSLVGRIKLALRHVPFAEALKRLRRRYIFWKRLRNVVLVSSVSPIAPKGVE